MLDKIKQFTSRNLINIPGFRTNRKIVILESDDWGSIRMPSIKVFDALANFGIKVNNSPYCRFDSLESNTDMEQLFETLIKYEDLNGNNPVITANTVMVNPNFELIAEKRFQEYEYEYFTETLKRYPNHNNVLELYKQGINQKIFFPQFHGREHVNVEMWMELIKNNSDFKFAFENRMWGLSNDIYPEMKSIQATFDSSNNNFLEESIKNGLDIFQDIFGFRSESFIANNFIWDSSLEIVLAECGIRHIQGMKYQKLPKTDDNPRKLIRHILGERNIHNQVYSIRNCSFEPTIDGTGHEKTLKEIENSFFWKKPAIISTHRINFIGSLAESNRKNNISELKLLLRAILTKWPKVEFMTSMDLDKIIRKNHE